MPGAKDNDKEQNEPLDLSISFAQRSHKMITI